MVAVGTGTEDLVEVAAAGRDPDGHCAALGHSAARAAMRRMAQVMVHVGGSVDEQALPVADPTLAVPLATSEDGSAEVEAAGALVLVGRAGDARFSAGDAQLATAVARQLSLGVQNARIVAELRVKEVLERELELAAEMQRSLLPASAPLMPNASLAAACLPAAHVGGDYYDFVPGPRRPVSGPSPRAAAAETLCSRRQEGRSTVGWQPPAQPPAPVAARRR